MDTENERGHCGRTGLLRDWMAIVLLLGAILLGNAAAWAMESYLVRITFTDLTLFEDVDDGVDGDAELLAVITLQVGGRMETFTYPGSTPATVDVDPEVPDAPYTVPRDKFQIVYQRVFIGRLPTLKILDFHLIEVDKDAITSTINSLLVSAAIGIVSMAFPPSILGVFVATGSGYALTEVVDSLVTENDDLGGSRETFVWTGSQLLELSQRFTIARCAHHEAGLRELTKARPLTSSLEAPSGRPKWHIVVRLEMFNLCSPDDVEALLGGGGQ